MTERIKTDMKTALEHQDKISKALREIAEQEARGYYVPDIVKEYARVGIKPSNSPRTLEDIYNNWI